MELTCRMGLCSCGWLLHYLIIQRSSFLSLARAPLSLSTYLSHTVYTAAIFIPINPIRHWWQRVTIEVCQPNFSYHYFWDSDFVSIQSKKRMKFVSTQNKNTIAFSFKPNIKKCIPSKTTHLINGSSYICIYNGKRSTSRRYVHFVSYTHIWAERTKMKIKIQKKKNH